jgi:hypothetical protein
MRLTLILIQDGLMIELVHGSVPTWGQLKIFAASIAWYNGFACQYHFVIDTSTDGISFTNVFSGDSSGTTASSEKYIIPSTDARYVRVTINGNTQNNAASIMNLISLVDLHQLNSTGSNNQAVTTSKNIAKDITLTASDP